jgi:hypothetical protein
MIPLNAVSAPPSGEDLRGANARGAQAIAARGEYRSAQTVAQRRRRITAQFRERFREMARELVGEETKLIRNSIEEHLGRRDLASLEEWLRDYFSGEGAERASEIARPVISTFAQMLLPQIEAEVDADADIEQEYTRFMDEYIRVFGVRHAGSSKGQLIALLRDAEIEDKREALEQRLAEWEEKRADKVVAEETVRGESAFARAGFLAMGVRKLMSVALGDSCPYCRALDGQIIAIDQPFIGAGQDFQPDGAEAPLTPSRNVHHPPYHADCDCTVVSAR